MRVFNEKGNTLITMPIIMTVTFLIILTFILTFIHLMEPFIVYEKMSSSALKYIFIMEEYGFLTKQEEEKLKSELVSKGLNNSQLTVQATNSKKDYGELINLKLTYCHNLKMPKVINSLIPQFKEKTVEINVEKQSFSKR